MTDKSRQEQIAECVTILAESYRQRVTEITFKTYDIGLNDLEIGDIKRAVMRALRECKFMPTVHELRKLCGASESSIDSKNRPLAAWQAVREAIKKVGGYDSLCFDDPVVNATVRELGGWVTVCETLSSEMHWLEKRFCATYAALCNCKLSDDPTRRLAGISEISNSREGYQSEPVKVAHIRCLTGSGNEEKFITWREESPAQSVRDVAKLANTSTEALSLAVSIDQPVKPNVSDRETETSDRPKSKPQQIAELKRVTNQPDDQSKAG